MVEKEQKKVKKYLLSVQDELTEIYEKIMATHFGDEKLARKFEKLLIKMNKDEFDMRQLGLRGCIWDDNKNEFKDRKKCPDFVFRCCNWCSGIGDWNPELRKEYERRKNERN